MSKDYPTAINSIPQLERLSRILEVGYALRNYELRPYQRTQAQLLRNKLELLEHACQNLIDAKKNADSKIDVQHEMEEIDQLRKEISANAARLVKAFEAVSK